jgi:signal transduction histidine kinase
MANYPMFEQAQQRRRAASNNRHAVAPSRSLAQLGADRMARMMACNAPIAGQRATGVLCPHDTLDSGHWCQQCQQVLLNLIVNACDAMESNPPEHRNLTLTTFIARDEILIGVLDRGVGLPDDVETLFQPFHSTKHGGLGMGLSICRTLVTSHGGRLWAERRAERGAAFYVALPLAKGDA